MPVTVTIDSDGVAQVLLNRPAKRNALDIAMIESLGGVVARIAKDTHARAVLVRGAGETFCAGADIADWVDPAHTTAQANSRLGLDAFDALARLPVPTVAVIEGGAFGGGLELALACDLRIATNDATLGLPELGLGNLPSWGGMSRLVDVAGLGVARHLLLSGELITGERAAELGVVTSAHPAADLSAAVEETTARLMNAEPTAVRLAKQFLTGAQTSLIGEDALAGYTACLDTSRDRKQAFLDRKAAARAARPSATPTHEGAAS